MTSPRSPAAIESDTLRQAKRGALQQRRAERLSPLFFAVRAVAYGVALPVALLGLFVGGHWWTFGDRGGLELHKREGARAAVDGVRDPLSACFHLLGESAPEQVRISLAAQGEQVWYPPWAQKHDDTVTKCISRTLTGLRAPKLRHRFTFDVTLYPRMAATVKVTAQMLDRRGGPPVATGPVALTADKERALLVAVREVASCAALHGVTERLQLSLYESDFRVDHEIVGRCATSSLRTPSELVHRFEVQPAHAFTAPLRYDLTDALR